MSADVVEVVSTVAFKRVNYIMRKELQGYREETQGDRIGELVCCSVGLDTMD